MDRLKQAKLFFEGKLNQEDARSFLSWYLSEESEEEIYTEIDKLWLAGKKDNEDYEWDGKPLFDKIQNIKENEFSLHTGKAIRYTNDTRKKRNYWSIAAVIAVLILGSISILILKNNNQFSDLRNSETFVVKSNPHGQKSKVFLPDGSVVYLNAGSHLSYSPEEFASVRNIKLQGEAFFEVTKDSQRPFTVVAQRLSTTALGTSFNIKAFEDDDQIEVTLVSGKVKVWDYLTRKTMMLDPGEGIQVKGNSEKFNKNQVDVLSRTQWKDGILFFKNTDFSEVITTLKRWYGVDIEVHGAPEKVKCSGSFNNEYLSNVLEVLSHSVGFEYTIDDKKVALFF